MGSRIENEFVPYEQALALKKLGFNNYCLTCYLNGSLQTDPSEIFWFQHSYRSHSKQEFVSAPTFSQAFRWFREKYNVHSSPRKYDETKWWVEWGTWTSPVFETYEEAEFSWLEKLIEIVKTK